MTKRLLPIIVSLCLLLPALPALATGSGPYLEVQGFATWINESKNQTDQGDFSLKFDSGTGYAAALGYDLGEAYPEIGTGRLELEVASRKGSLQNAKFADATVPASGDLKVTSYMVNTIAEYHELSIWVPYFLVGAGYAEVSFDGADIYGMPLDSGSSDKVFAYQAGGGLGMEIGDHVTLDLGYRYFATLDPELKQADGSKIKSEFGSHNVLLGLRFKY